jgi:hypothetical protein
MNCYSHNDNTAFGVCKHCTKAVCPECAIDTNEGLACSETCVQEIKSYNLMMNKSKDLYGIGKDGKKMPVTIIMYSLFSVIFLVVGTFRTIYEPGIDIFALGIGAIFGILGIIYYSRNKKLGTNF